MLSLVFCCVVTADDVSELKIPVDAVEREATFRPWTFIKTKKAYFVGKERVAERLFFKDGQLADERLYRNEKRHGVWRQYWPNGKLFAERPYRDGQMDGVFRFWDENGNLQGESALKNGTGVLREYRNDAVHSHDKETPYVDGKINGVAKYWAKFEGCQGIGCSVAPYSNGARDGWEVTRDEDGTLIAWSHAKTGRVHGVMQHFDHEGNPLAGFPKYVINGEHVTEQQFVDAAKSDRTLAATLNYSPARIEKIPPRDPPAAAAKEEADPPK